MKLQKHLVIACVCALAAWMPVANAQLHGRQETRSGILEFEANGYPTDADRRTRARGDRLPARRAGLHPLRPGRGHDAVAQRALRPSRRQGGRPDRLPDHRAEDADPDGERHDDLRHHLGGVERHRRSADVRGAARADRWRGHRPLAAAGLGYRHGRAGSRQGRQVPDRAGGHEGPGESRGGLRDHLQDQHGADRHPHPDPGSEGRAAHSQRPQDPRPGQGVHDPGLRSAEP